MISCLMPTFNRPGSYNGRMLLADAVESFLRQEYAGKVELLVCNDTPGQTLSVAGVPMSVRVLNCSERFPTLSAKLQYMIAHAEGDFFCRWDDDDINLPWRLRASHQAMIRHSNNLEWRPAQYWWLRPSVAGLEYISHPGNTHCMAIWRREILESFPDGMYPQGMSGWEDQAFNAMADQVGKTVNGILLPEAVFYIYRWGVSPAHLSVKGGSHADLQRHYDEIGARPITRGSFEIKPAWSADYEKMARAAC